MVTENTHEYAKPRSTLVPVKQQQFSKTEILKVLPEYFAELLTGNKTFEIRDNDRDFQVSDILILKEYSKRTNSYTGRYVKRVVTYILDNADYVPEGMVVLAIKPLDLTM